MYESHMKLHCISDTVTKSESMSAPYESHMKAQHAMLLYISHISTATKVISGYESSSSYVFIKVASGYVTT